MNALQKNRTPIRMGVCLALWVVGAIMLVLGVSDPNQWFNVIPGALFLCTGVWLLDKMLFDDGPETSR